MPESWKMGFQSSESGYRVAQILRLSIFCGVTWIFGWLSHLIDRAMRTIGGNPAY